MIDLGPGLTLGRMLVIPRPGERLTAPEIMEFARGKVANFKVPKYVEIVDHFPLTGSGKVHASLRARREDGGQLV